MNAPRLLLRASCHAGSVMRLFLLMGIMLGGAAKPASANESPVACITSVTPPSPRAGQSVTVSGSCSDDDDGFLTRYEWTFSDGLFSKTSNQASVTRTVDASGVYTVMLRVKDNDGAWSIRIKRKFTVTAATFTVNVLPSAGCAVTAGDGGVDVVEAPNGIVCSGGMAANDPLCAEQFKNSDIAALKVVPDTGYVFTGWTVNGAQFTVTSAEPFLLTTMPVLAQNSSYTPTLINGNKADCQANCSRVAITTPSSVKRDEIFDVIVTLYPPPLWDGMTVTFDLVGQKTQDLPERGEVQMYDFGYDADGDGDIEPGQTAYTFIPLLDLGRKTIKAVYNLSETPPKQPTSIKIAATLGIYTFESEPIAVTYQIRKYTTMDFNSKVNDFDSEITNWLYKWQNNPWNTPTDKNQYQFKTTDFDDDLIKAICYKESTMKNNNLMQVKQEGLDGLRKDKDWDWSVPSDGGHPIKKWLVYPLHAKPLMNYTEVKTLNPDTISASDSVHWGIRYLYAKRSISKYDFWYVDKKKKVECTKCTKIDAPPDCCTGKLYDPVWYDVEQTLQRYNSDADEDNATYASSILALYHRGKTPHDKANIQYLWPIMTDQSARQ